MSENDPSKQGEESPTDDSDAVPTKKSNENGTVEDKATERIVRRLTASFTSSVNYQGPFLPPEWLDRYENYYPGVTKLLVDNTVSQTPHRMKLEEAVVHDNIKKSARGQWMAFVLFGSLILGGLSAVFAGYDVAGTIVAIGTAGSALGLFIYRRRKSDRELDEKAS